MRGRSLVPVVSVAALGLAPFFGSCAPANPLALPPTPDAASTASAAPPVALADPKCGSASTPPAASTTGESEPVGEAFSRKANPTVEKDRCETADSNLAAAESELLAGTGKKVAIVGKPWDHKSKPVYFDLVDKRFALSKTELSLINKNGFVASGRVPFPSYASAFHEVYQSQLPVYISPDAILHAVYVANDNLIADLERKRLVPILDQVLARMHCTLPTASAHYPAEIAHDLDVYLTVARSLLSGAKVASVFPESDKEVSALLVKAKAADQHQPYLLFGRERMVDFTQLTPRGHYSDDLAPYFRAAMWLARVEFNLVTRSCKSSQPGLACPTDETPREATDALALADLAEQAGSLDDIALLDSAWALLAGRREDVPIAELAKINHSAGVTDFLPKTSMMKLKDAIGSRFKRTTRIHYQPEMATELPAIATFLGPRIVADSTALMPVIAPHVPGRTWVHSHDVAYALGHNHAKRFLDEDLKAYPSLDVGLTKSRAILQAPIVGEDLYGSWLSAVRGLAPIPSGSPSFMNSEAFADMRIGSAVAGFAQLRHNYVLMAAETYFAGGCEIPDGWVEPAPAMYTALIEYAGRGLSVMPKLDPKDVTGGGVYFRRLARVLKVLDYIQKTELLGQPLSDAEKRWLSMVVEMAPGSTGSLPTYTGWYFDLAREREDALKTSALIADYFTGETKHSYAGRSARLRGVRHERVRCRHLTPKPRHLTSKPRHLTPKPRHLNEKCRHLMR